MRSQFRHSIPLREPFRTALSGGAFDWAAYWATLNIAGTGSDETDYITRFIVHREAQLGDLENNEIFYEMLQKSDFSNIRFFDPSDNVIPHYVNSYGNFAFISDNLRVNNTHICWNGNLYNSTSRSIDNGENWVVIAADKTIKFVDSAGYVFADADGKLYRSDDTINQNNFVEVLDLTGTISVQFRGMVEHDGVIILGDYGSGVAKIYRSTDHGATWNNVYTRTATGVHFHGVGVDPYTGYFYGGIDTTNELVRSVDGGLNWSVIYTPIPAFTQMYAGNGFRLFGGEGAITRRGSIWRTTDDVTFTIVMSSFDNVFSFSAINDNIYAMTMPHWTSGYQKLMRSTDNGLTWQTCLIDNYIYEVVSSNGLYPMTESVLPNGETENQILLRRGYVSYHARRIFDGSTHNHGLIYLKIPTLPAAGMQITMKQGYPNTSDVTILNNDILQANLIARYKLNEGTGIVANDSSGNDYHGAITTGAGGWNVFGGRRFGNLYPYKVFQNKSYNFGDGSYLTITGSEAIPALQFVKNFTICLWAKLPTELIPNYPTWYNVLGRGTGYDYMGIKCVKDRWAFWYGDGAAALNYKTYIYCSDQSSFVFVAITLDNSTPAKHSYTFNGYTSAASALAYDPVLSATEPWKVGDIERIGDIADIQIYSPALTAAQLREIYENRKIAATEPIITLSP